MAVGSTAKRSPYRPARQLPYELREQCSIYFEEGLYSQALILLNNTLTAGSSITTSNGRPPAFLPPPQHLSLAATLIVHPSVTTKATSNDRRQAADDALKLLRSVNKIVGPVNADLGTAFAFRGERNRPGRTPPGKWANATPQSGESDDGFGQQVNSELARRSSVWARAQDFWHVVGWAFNCSVKHEARWARWRIWLELVMDVLEDDWKARAKSEDEKKPSDTGLVDSIVLQYLSGADVRAGRRRVMRAIFADGGVKSVNEFHAVFKNEVGERKKAVLDITSTPLKKVDFEENWLGDGEEGSEDEAVQDIGSRSSVRVSRPKPSTPEIIELDSDGEGASGSSGHTEDAVEKFGGIYSMILRQRILALLLRVAAAVPAQFMELDELFDLVSEFIRPLPLPVFNQLVSPSALPYFDKDAQSSLNMMLFGALSPSGPYCIKNDMDQDLLERFFLPYAASSSSVVDNAKVSLLVESLMRLVHQHVGLEPRASLRMALEKGVNARTEKVEGRKRVSDNRKEEGEAKSWLNFSSQRMTALLGIAETCRERT